MIGTFLICAIGGDRIMNIEISGGLIYEIINADEQWVHGDGSKLQSGTKVILPPGTEIVGNAKIDFKGGKPRVSVEEQQQQQKQPRKILITGASGYVGQHLLASIALQGIDGGTDSSNGDTYEIFLAYNALPTFEDDLNDLLGHITVHPSIAKFQPVPNIDFSTSDYIQKIQNAGATSLDAIIHLAALSSPGYCENNASDAWKVNCPVGLLSFGAPIIYLSTDQIYEGTKSYYQEDTDETLPVNVYGRTKLAFERVLLGSDVLLSEKELGGNSTSGCIPDAKSVPPPNPNSTILRSSLILGGPTPLKNGCRKGSFPSFLQFIESRLRSATPTDYFINEFRSVVHVTDVLRAIKHFLNKALKREPDSQRKAEIYNLGGSTRVSRYDIALKLASHLKLDHSTNGVDRPANRGVPSPPDISMNVDKIANEIGVAKMDGLDEIIEQTFSVGK